MQKYCDIVPDATGWIYVIDGVQSKSYYHTCELAMRAAEVQLGKTDRFRRGVFRQQAANGEMLPMKPDKGGISPNIMNG
jgi:hypothetical protein